MPRPQARLLEKRICVAFYLQIAYFREWACLDSNQGPLPYQRSTTLCRRFPEFAKYLQTVIFSARGFSQVCWRLTQVAAWLLHIYLPSGMREQTAATMENTL